ncbi:MAG: hypothetical protein M9890_13225 [Thermomicrobiales bacterium]|nr:hypothetical protein [Thermomicrobiales bacterium]
MTGAIYSNLGNVANRKGETQRATTALREALTLNVAMNDPRQIAVTLERFAAVAVTDRQVERAARLLGAAQQIRSRLARLPRPPNVRKPTRPPAPGGRTRRNTLDCAVQ